MVPFVFFWMKVVSKVGVSKNRGTPKMGGLQWKTLLKWMIWGHPYFWKHPSCFQLKEKKCLKHQCGDFFVAIESCWRSIGPLKKIRPIFMVLGNIHMTKQLLNKKKISTWINEVYLTCL